MRMVNSWLDLIFLYRILCYWCFSKDFPILKLLIPYKGLYIIYFQEGCSDGTGLKYLLQYNFTLYLWFLNKSCDWVLQLSYGKFHLYTQRVECDEFLVQLSLTVIDIWSILLYVCIPLHLSLLLLKENVRYYLMCLPLIMTTRNTPLYFQNMALMIVLLSIETHFCRAL